VRMAEVKYGYECWEYEQLRKIPPVKVGVKVSELDDSDTRRRVVGCSLGPTFQGYSMPHPSPGPTSALAGALKRFATKPPKSDVNKIKRLKDFVKIFLEKYLVPLDSDSDMSDEKWLGSTNYPEWRKDELRDVIEDINMNGMPAKWGAVNSFVKDETYPDFKFARAINSRSDHAKVRFGPWFKAIETEVFKLPFFIKKVPMSDRAQYIFDLLYKEGSEYWSSDYTSFEALFTLEIMDAVEFQLYSYMTQFLPGHDSFMKDVYSVLGGVNQCNFKNFRVDVPATRMSGEMCTSLGNGFSNLMFVAFLCEELGIDWKGVVEGDDGLFRFDGPGPKTEDFASLGLVIKMERHEKLETASFCGNVFDVDDLLIVTDPKEILVSVGWTSSRYVKASQKTHLMLLRAKAWSYGYQYPGMPIVSEMAKAYLRLTSGFDLNKLLNKRNGLNMWEREQLLEAMGAGRPALNRIPPIKTRLLVAELYGVSVEQQLAYEEYFRNLKEIEQIPDLGIIFPDSWREYSIKYTCNADVNDPLLEYPSYLYSREPIEWPIPIVSRSNRV
jgi:hypothetical protein